ncbi:MULTISPECIES: TetR/AcrR family transcriptional regulator [Rhodoplanes]|nr:helix-turn-helix domain-containing protein [Rhodoplanes serenus]
MPRPKLHSDTTILNAARSVMLRKGPSEFTLSDVATAVGLSRAALIQRFTDKATLHRRVMERTTQEVRDYFATAAFGPGLDPLWAMLRDLISGMEGDDDMSGYLLLFWSDIQDPGLTALARERNDLVHAAIAARLPPTPHPPETAARIIQAVIQGACMLGLVSHRESLAAFMTEQTRRILQVLYPDHAFT